MEITVTQEDIDQGMPWGGNSCPLALALRRQGLKDVRVGCVHFEYKTIHGSQSNEEEWEWVFLPKTAQIFRDRFDHGRPVKPFKFELKGIDDSL